MILGFLLGVVFFSCDLYATEIKDGWERVLTFKESTASHTKGWRTIAHGNDIYLAVAVEANGSTLYRSVNGKTFEQVKDFPEFIVGGLTVIEDTFYLYGRWNDPLYIKESEYPIYTSNDGIVWEKNLFPEVYGIKSMAGGDGKFILVGGAGELFYTNDFKTWSKVQSSEENREMSGFKEITYGLNGFVAVGYSIDEKGFGWGFVSHSTDGTTFNTIDFLDRPNSFEANAFIQVIRGAYVAGDGQRLFVSLNGTDWTIHENMGGHAIAYGGNEYILIQNASNRYTRQVIFEDLFNTSNYFVRLFEDELSNILDIVASKQGFFAITEKHGYFLNIESDERYPKIISDEKGYLKKGTYGRFNIRVLNIEKVLYSITDLDGSPASLPKGIRFDEEDGVFRGTPNELGKWEYRVNVQDKNNPSREISHKFTLSIVEDAKIMVSASPQNAGEVFGGGVYVPNSEVLVSAKDKVGYRFLYWSENGEFRSEEREYRFVANQHRTLVAEFQRKKNEFPFYAYQIWSKKPEVDRLHTFQINFSKPIGKAGLLPPMNGIYVKNSSESLIPVRILLKDYHGMQIQVVPIEPYVSGETYYLYLDNAHISGKRPLPWLRLPLTVVMPFVIR